MTAAVHGPAPVIGPNAVLQMVPVIARDLGPHRLADILAGAGLTRLPDGSAMIPEEEARRLHRTLREAEPAAARRIAAAAGVATADYILAHRIPRAAQLVLKALPAALAAPLLARAISRHAWTFAGSGTFRRRDAWTFEIAGNPLIRGERSPLPLCAWHAAVFERLYAVLVSPDCRCEEVTCAAQGSDTCRFRIRRHRPAR